MQNLIKTIYLVLETFCECHDLETLHYSVVMQNKSKGLLVSI